MWLPFPCPREARPPASHLSGNKHSASPAEAGPAPGISATLRRTPRLLQPHPPPVLPGWSVELPAGRARTRPGRGNAADVKSSCPAMAPERPQTTSPSMHRCQRHFSRLERGGGHRAASGLAPLGLPKRPAKTTVGSIRGAALRLRLREKPSTIGCREATPPYVTLPASAWAGLCIKSASAAPSRL